MAFIRKRVFEKIHKRRSQLIVLFLLLLLLGIRLYPIILYGDRSLGYDTGIYRHVILGYAERFSDPNAPPFAFAALSNMLIKLGGGVDFIMYGLYLLIVFLTGYLCYLVSRLYFSSRVAGYFCLFLYDVSVVQYDIYWHYLYRMNIAVLGLLLSFLFIYRRSPFLFVPFILICLIHPLSFIPLAITLTVVLFLGEKEKRRYLLRHILICLLVCGVFNYKEFLGYIYLVFDNGVSAKSFVQNGYGEFTGQFMSGWGFLFNVLLYLPSAVWGFWLLKKQNILFSVFFICNIILAGLGFVFYTRFFVFIDLMLIFYASFALSRINFLKDNKLALAKILTVLFVVILLFQNIRYVMARKPLVSAQEFSAISLFDNNLEDLPIISFSTYYAPWIYGFSNNIIIAPGMFEYNMWNSGEWQNFRLSSNEEERSKLLQRYNYNSFYIFLGDNDENFAFPFLLDSHLTFIFPHIWKYTFSSL